jgi:SNF2 family DNA or RNA helicase
MKSVRPFIKRIVGLTGTPAPNGLLDLWPQIYLLDMGKRLGRYISAYRNEYFVPDKRNGQVIYSYKPRPYAEREIYKKINDLCVSMKAADYIKMPDRVDNFIEVKMSDNEKRLYDRLERDTLLPFSDGDIDAVNAAALATKLLQMANGAVYDENKIVKHIHNKKLEALEDLYEAANGKPVLIFYMYKHDRDRIKALIGQDARELDSARDIADWNAGRIKAAIAHPASTGHGLNLQSGGSTIIWFGLTWSLELYQQANARLWRQGQKETVIVHHLVTKDTIDEQVMKVLQKKEKGQSALMNAVKARLGPK